MRIAGFAGGSGAGKSALARAVARRLGEERVLLLTQDDYYHDLSARPFPERAATNFDEPAALDLDLLAGHLEALRRGGEIEVPRYDLCTHTRAGSRRERPRPFVLVEGTMIAAKERLRAALDLLVYVDLPAGERFARRLARDTAERARPAEEVRRQWEATVLPMHERHVEPARDLADLVLPGNAPLEGNARRVARRLRPGLLRRMALAWRARREAKRARALARRALQDLFRRPERLRGTSLRPEHAARAVLLDFAMAGNRIVSIAFGLLRHPRPHPFSRQFHEVLEFYRADLSGDGPVERVKGVNLSRAKGGDGEPGGVGPGV